MGVIYFGPQLWDPENAPDEEWRELDAEIDRHADNESLDLRAEQLAPATQVECPACVGEGCAACRGEGWVWATGEDDAALVAFHQAAAAFLHPSGFGDR